MPKSVYRLWKSDQPVLKMPHKIEESLPKLAVQLLASSEKSSEATLGIQAEAAGNLRHGKAVAGAQKHCYNTMN